VGDVVGLAGKCSHQATARWLPPGYSDYGSLLTAALENAVSILRRKRLPAVLHKSIPSPSRPQSRTWGKNYPVEIDHLVLSQIPLIGRFTGPDCTR